MMGVTIMAMMCLQEINSYWGKILYIAKLSQLPAPVLAGAEPGQALLPSGIWLHCDLIVLP